MYSARKNGARYDTITQNKRYGVILMLSQDMVRLGMNRSAIRELFEYAKKRKEEIGAQNVFDFSLGNPSVDAPQIFTDTLEKLIASTAPAALHGYTSAPGDFSVRQTIAERINARHGTGFDANNIFMTCGAAASLCVSLRALCEPNDEVILLAPFFPEYSVFAKAAGMTPRVVQCLEDSFEPDIAAIDNAINEHTKAIIVNSPNNPSGVVYSEQSLRELCALLRKKKAQYGHPIVLISDEPYRELVFDGAQVPYLTKLYDDTLVCYSYSKSLSLPGERIGYIVAPDEIESYQAVFAALSGAARALGYVCAPSLFQYAIAKCPECVSDIDVYDRNRRALCETLRECGFSFPTPLGAFYLFLKSPEPDAAAFCERAKRHELLIVPSDSFGCGGYARLAFCVSEDMLARSLPAFRELAREYGLCK